MSLRRHHKALALRNELPNTYEYVWYNDRPLSELKVLWYNEFETITLTFQDKIGRNADYVITPIQYLNIYKASHNMLLIHWFWKDYLIPITQLHLTNQMT